MRGWGHPYSSLPVRPACLLNSCSLVPSTKKRDEETSSTLAPHPNTALGGPRGFGLDQNQSHATPAWPGSWGSHCRDAEGGRGVGSDGGGEGATRGEQPKAAAGPKLHRQMRRPIDTEPGCIDVQQPDRHMGSRRHSSAPHRRANWVRCVTGAGRHLMSSSPRAGGKERDKGGVSTASSRRSRSRSESWLLTSASMSPGARTRENPVVQMPSLVPDGTSSSWSKQPKLETKLELWAAEIFPPMRHLENPEIWDAGGCAVIDASKAIVFEPR